MHEIEEGITKNGFHEEWWLVLQNVYFRSDDGEKTSQQKLEEWCKQKSIKYEVFERPDAHKKMQQIMRFTKR